MGKDKKGINPADAFRREEKKKQQKKQEQQRKVVREVRGLLNDPDKIEDEIKRVQKQSDENRLDKSLKDRIIELKNMKSVALKKIEMDTMLGRKPHHSASSSSAAEVPTGPSIPTMRRPEESVYFHPVHNPTGVPPPGMKPIFRNMPGAPQLPPAANAGYPYTQPPSTTAYGLPRAGAPRPNMVMGGMNGIPLPPPRLPMQPPRGMAAPQFYVPGGSIPPPPPPPPMMNIPAMPYATTGAYTAPVNPRANKPQKERKQPAYSDPLDPSADGYVHRFGRTAREETRHEPISDTDKYLAQHMTSAIGSANPFQHMTTAAVEEADGYEYEQPGPANGQDEDDEDSDEDEEGDEGDEDEENDDGEEDDSSEDDQNEETGEEEPVAARPAPTFDFSTFAGQALSAEELLARKNKSVMSYPEDDVEQKADVGPTPPPAVFDFAAAFAAPMLSAEELMRRRRAMMEEAVVEEEEDVGPAMPPASEEYASFAPLPGYDYQLDDDQQDGGDSDGESGGGGCLLPGMEAYGDSDEEEEEAKPAQQVAPVAVQVKASIQHHVEVDTTSVLGKRVLETPPVAPHHHKVEEEIAVKKPKVIQADHAVTAFVPNVLKNKKPVGKFAPKPPTLPPPPLAAPIAAAASNSLEDAYSQFLNEIEGL